MTITARLLAELNEIELVIEDSGVGIPQDMIDSLFSAHANVGRRGTEGEIGIGFCLPIVKAVVESFGGRVEVESSVAPTGGQQGQGTRVKFVLRTAKSLVEG